MNNITEKLNKIEKEIKDIKNDINSEQEISKQTIDILLNLICDIKSGKIIPTSCTFNRGSLYVTQDMYESDFTLNYYVCRK